VHSSGGASYVGLNEAQQVGLRVELHQLAQVASIRFDRSRRAASLRGQMPEEFLGRHWKRGGRSGGWRCHVARSRASAALASSLMRVRNAVPIVM
jgi:hypothetical protein